MTHREHRPLSPWRVLLAVALLAACILFIWSNSLKPPDVSAQFSKRVAEVLYRLLSPLFGAGSWIVRFTQTYIRKIGHAVEFAMLGVTLVTMLAVLGRVRGHFIAHAAFVVLMVAVADETIQFFTGRGSSVLDVVLDFAGGLGGILVALAVCALVRALSGRGRQAYEES